MVSTRGKKKTGSSHTYVEVNKAETQIVSDSLIVDVVEPNEDAQLEDRVDVITEEARNENSEEMSGEESEKEAEEDIENPNMPETETNGDNRSESAESEENTFEDDEVDDQEDMPWEDEEEHFEHENEERVLDEFEVSEEEPTEEDEVSEEEPTEEDEASEEEATEKANDEDDNQEKKENSKQDTREAHAKENEREAKEHNQEKLESNLKKINKLNERSRKKKVQAVGLKKVDSEDKPESSLKRKGKKRVDSMGIIFMCSSETKKDCYQYKVLGLPESKKDIVEKIYAGMRLFLYDLDLKLMYGIYKAVGPGGYNIEPKAFKSQFPSQVRFKVLENCLPIPEEKFKIIIKENYYTKTKFDCQLNSEQVKKLCRLFNASSKGRPSKKLSRSLKGEKHPMRRERNKRQRTGVKRRLPLREEVKHNERPRKRLRKVLSPAPPPRRRLPGPQLSRIPSSYVHKRALDADAYRRDLYLEHRSPSPYRDRRERPLIRRDTYRGVRDPSTERNERYRDGRDSHLERRYAYRGSRDSLIDHRDPYVDDVVPYSRRRDLYRDERSPYLEPRDTNRDGPDPYLERRDSYRDEREPYLERPDSYRDGRASYLDRRVPFGGSAHSGLYNSYRRDPLLESRDVYREDRGGEFRDSYRRDDLLVRRDLHPIDSETRSIRDIVGRDAYISSRERPSYAEPLYPATYPPRGAVC